MNYVAHQVLSFGDPNLQLGNLLGEVVKGNQYQQYSPNLQKGILLHRQIDTFTDAHPIVKESTALLHADQGKFSPIVIDVIFDYFLIQHWETFVTQPFKSFKKNCYQLFKTSEQIFPPKLQYIIYHLLLHDWFENYTTLEGVALTLRNIGKRTKFENRLANSLPILRQHLPELERNFFSFYPQLEQNCRRFLFR
ncbi:MULTISPECIES: ACP phosphodiesterase [Weeksella]|uniref:acyl carrier protein phosphodiesterase n=1 Tax=Weeksella TaxID=1013 RepID=UPI0008A2858A|nr:MULTISPECIES: ACP phosphodiesterase [Weeksella]MDK7374461.1 ACP phosphodiesterase [Weeksella virosa]MDK7675590.1 ACP phosphodiesterase [Weeksella virosa]OFM81849.1 ACP phosphodiesterase [Weeksella sp. HMSC059D05]